MRRMLADEGFSIKVVTNLSSVYDELPKGYDAVVLDLNLPDSQGYDTFEAVERMSGTVPVVVLTSNSNKETAMRAMRHGAQDYLFKETIIGEVMVRSIRYAILRKRLVEEEKARVELQRSNADLQRFAHIASHDLKEPLRMVSLYLRLLKTQYRDRLDAKAQSYIDFAVEGSQRMNAMVEDLLAYSMVDKMSMNPSMTDMNEVLALAQKDLDAGIKESGATITHDSLPTIMADKTQMVLLLQNLISNAIKYRGPEPPKVHVSVERGEE